MKWRNVCGVGNVSKPRLDDVSRGRPLCICICRFSMQYVCVCAVSFFTPVFLSTLHATNCTSLGKLGHMKSGTFCSTRRRAEISSRLADCRVGAGKSRASEIETGR